ncbi:MAG: hypothetical protein V8S89_03925 [Oscillospiraceae bacterium]
MPGDGHGKRAADVYVRHRKHRQRPGDADDAITLRDTFQPILRNLTATLNGETLSIAQGDYTYDETTGIFATLPGRITVPAATYTQAEDGTWVTTPGTAVLTVTGTV